MLFFGLIYILYFLSNLRSEFKASTLNGLILKINFKKVKILVQNLESESAFSFLVHLNSEILSTCKMFSFTLGSKWL